MLNNDDEYEENVIIYYLNKYYIKKNAIIKYILYS